MGIHICTKVDVSIYWVKECLNEMMDTQELVNDLNLENPVLAIVHLNCIIFQVSTGYGGFRLKSNRTHSYSP